MPLFTQGRLIDYGPRTGDDVFAEASSGDESEVEITGLDDSRLILDKTHAEGKGGPRMQQVVDEILDTSMIYTTVSQRLIFRILWSQAQQITSEWRVWSLVRTQSVFSKGFWLGCRA